MKKLNSKGQYTFDSLPSVVLAFTLAAVFFVVGIIILASMGDNTNFYTVSSVSNESFTVGVVGSTVTTAEGWVQSVTYIKNASHGGTFPTTNYTVTGLDRSAGAVITITSNASICVTGTACGIYYTYKDKSAASGEAIADSLVALEEIPSNWLLLIATVLAATIIIGLVVRHMKGGVDRS